MYGSARSPPPLQHPRPQHPPSHLPSTSPPPPEHYGAYSPNGGHSSIHASGPAGGYQRFASPPAHSPQGVYASYLNAPPPSNAYGAFHAPQQSSSSSSSSSAPQPPASQRGGPSAPNAAASSHAQSAQSMPAWADPGQGWNFNDPTTAMGVQLGKQAFDAGQKYIDQNVSRWLPTARLKHSFNVSNGYVLKKIRLVLWPWRHKSWSRSAASDGYQPPREDINCPDMYIPVMALVTYILLSAIIAGSQGQFNPAILGRTASKSIGLLCLEMFMVKLGCYLLGIGEDGTIVDLLAYEGYKFVGVIVTLVSGLLGAKGWLYVVVFLYTFFADFFFLVGFARCLCGSLG